MLLILSHEKLQANGIGDRMPKKPIKEYWWVSVAGESCEPAVLIEEEGERRAYTIGCKDYFSVDKGDCLLKLIERCEEANGIPLTPKQEKATWLKEKQRLKELSSHGYRKF